MEGPPIFNPVRSPVVSGPVVGHVWGSRTVGGVRGPDPRGALKGQEIEWQRVYGMGCGKREEVVAQVGQGTGVGDIFQDEYGPLFENLSLLLASGDLRDDGTP